MFRLKKIAFLGAVFATVGLATAYAKTDKTKYFGYMG